MNQSQPMKKQLRRVIVSGLLLLALPLAARAGELDSIFDSLLEVMKVLLGLVLLLVCLALLVVTLFRREPSAALTPLPPAEALPARNRFSQARVARVALLAAPLYATALYLAATDSLDLAAGRYLAFYASFLLPTLVAMALLWLGKRPSAALGLGLSGPAVVLLLSWQAHQWSLAARSPREPLTDSREISALQARTRIPDSLRHHLFTYVEQMPVFVGGPDSLQPTIRRRLRYPPQALARRVQGTVLLGILVDEDGRAAAVELVRGIGAGCDEEAIRVAQGLRFRPGRQGGRVVRVYMPIEVYFKLP